MLSCNNLDSDSLPDVLGELTSQGRATAGDRGVVTSADVELVVVLQSQIETRKS